MRLGQYRKELHRILHAREERVGALLEGVAGLLEASGSVYWGIFPTVENPTDLEKHPERFRLFTIDSWFDDKGEAGFFGYHSLPLNSTNVGRAVREGRVVAGYDPRTVAGSSVRLEFSLRENSMLATRGVNYMCAAPVYEGDRLTGALAVYRNGGPPKDWETLEPPSTALQREADVLEDIAVFLPAVFDSANAAQRLKAMRAVSNVLKDIESEKVRGLVTDRMARKNLDSLVKRLAEVFRSSEVTIFMRPLLEEAGEPLPFEPMATTWPRPEQLHPYAGVEAQGLTSWVLTNKRAVWIADLRSFEEDKAIYQSQYPRLEHKNSLRLEYSQGKMPISFIAAPVLVGDETVGCIRCVSRPDEPRHYTNLDAEALKLAGSLLGTAWRGWQTGWDIDQESGAWRSFLTELDKVLTKSLRVMTREDPSRYDLLKEILAVVPKFVPDAASPSVHLLDPVTRHLRQEYPADLEKESELDSRFAVDFPKSPRKNPRSLAVATFSMRKVTYWRDVGNNRLYACTVAKDARDLIVCPIQLAGETGSEPIGVISIRSRLTISDPDFTKRMAATLALQVAIFLRFLETIQDAQEQTEQAEQTAEKLAQQEGVLKRVFEDVRHQLKAPLNKAVMQVDRLQRVRRVQMDEHLKREASVLKGLCRKAASVARSVKLLADIEAGRRLTTHRVLLEEDMMRVFLIQMAEDHEMESDPDEPIRFSVDRDSLSKVSWQKHSADMELLEQVFFCLCDNALKYSFDNTCVDLRARQSEGRLVLSVTNVGTTVSAEESVRILERGVRGIAAQRYRGEGSGIGLFLVDQIARAHGGSFRIVPTDQDDVTIAEFVIP